MISSSAIPDTPALRELAASGVSHRTVRYRPATDVGTAARNRGVTLDRLVKTLVMRRGKGDYLLVLVPGDRTIDWPKLRRHLSVSRLSLSSPEEAHSATGYRVGTITPFGATGRWPVVADARVALASEVSIGGGAPGIAVNLSGRELVRYLRAAVADVTTVESRDRRRSWCLDSQPLRCSAGQERRSRRPRPRRSARLRLRPASLRATPLTRYRHPERWLPRH